MIQVISYTGKCEKYEGTLVKQYSFHDVRSLDEYDINVIDLSEEKMWRNSNDNRESVDCISDLKSIATMIVNSHSTKVVILYPQNQRYYYYYGQHQYRGGMSYKYSEELKNMLKQVNGAILTKLYQPISNVELLYENTKTMIGAQEYLATFYFANAQEILLKSVKSGKPTTVKARNVILSSLEMTNYDALITFLKEIHLLNEEEEKPEWMDEINLFDDNFQKEIISQNEEQITIAKSNIDAASLVLKENNRLKSVLYTGGSELVKVVFEILEEMLGCDLADFVDEMGPDFVFDIGDLVFIGEIKGVNHNVKSENVSQLDVHYQGYLDEHEDAVKENVVALLIMNHQKSKPISSREPVKQTQIDIAKRNGSLIIDTFTLLHLLEKYRTRELSREQLVQLLKESKGYLVLS